MPLPASGTISMSQIGTELSLASSNLSLRSMSSTAGKTSPDAMSEFYGYSAASMSRLFTEAGFGIVRSENNLYAKTASDSRIIGIK